MRRLLERIGMPEEAAERILAANVEIPGSQIAGICWRLCGRETYEQAYEELLSRLIADRDGFQMLKIMLEAASVSERLYAIAGIGEDIYTETMKCFSRFVREHQESFGRYGFDRGFWTGRQLSLTLFRLGALEYELTAEAGIVAVHIPSGADLSEEALNQSFDLAKDFFREHGTEVKAFACTSWLLSPALKELLRPDSGILRFQSRFSVTKVFPEDESYKLWIYKNSKLSPEKFPQDTSLQRAVKQYVLQGGKIGAACGFLQA